MNEFMLELTNSWFEPHEPVIESNSVVCFFLVMDVIMNQLVLILFEIVLYPLAFITILNCKG